MALDRQRVLETAQKYLAKGQYDKAIAEYQKLVQADPNDVRTWLKIGDLYTRKGARPEACDTYLRVAKQYADQGFFLKAVAVFKQILKLDPSRLDVSLALADMYEQLQLVSDALATYEQVAAAYARNGEVERALETLGRMTELDPENIPVRIKYAEALSKAGRTEDAASAFERGASLLKSQGRIDDYIKVAERLLYHRATDVALARELAELYVERNDPKRALGKLQLCFKANPHDIATLVLLAKAFESLSQLPKTISVYKEIARIHQEAGRDEERARTLAHVLELDPQDAEARQALARYAPRGPAFEPPPAAREEAPREDSAVELLEEDADVILAAEEHEAEELLEAEDSEEQVLLMDDEGEEEVREPSVEIAIAPPVAEPPTREVPRVPSIPPDVAREAQIARLLTECEVFQRYGLKAKVLEQLLKVLDIAPDHVEARERLKDVYVAEGRAVDAIRELYTLANQVEPTSPDGAQLYYAQIVSLDPGSEPARSKVAGAAPSYDDRTAPEISEDAGSDEVLFVEEANPADVITAEGYEPVSAPGFEDRTEIGERPLAPMSPEEFEAAPLRPSTPGEMRAAVERASLPPGEIEEILDEAEFFLAQGLMEEARATLRDALDNHPNHPLLRDKLSELADLASAPTSAAAREDDDVERPVSEDIDLESLDESFLLAEKLAEELGEESEQGTEAGSDVLDVESVFAQFKKGVEEQVGLEDSDTHFDLGIAYKEMGLLDDAIHEFGLAKSNSQRECIAYTMIGLCHVEKGEISEAIAQFKKGLYSDTKTDREELGLYFELGAAYELLHDPKEALYYFQKVQKREPKFRNVEEKIKALTQPKAPPPATTAAANIEDVDRAFDDLLGED